MKKLFLLLALFGLIFTACEGGDGIEEENGGTPFIPEITISPEELSFPVEGGEQEIIITANFEYNISERADWLSFEQTETGILVKVDNSERAESRYADIVISSKKYEIEKFITVSQAAFEPSIAIRPSLVTFSAKGGEQEVIITSNVEYEVSERASWLSVEQTEMGLIVTADESKSTSERTAYISITNEKYSITKTIDVVQEAWEPKIELAQQSIEVEFEPAEYEVAVTSPYSWEATTKNDWIVVTTETGVAGEEVLKFSTKRNEDEKERKGTITLKNSDYNLVAELYITQKTFVPEWEVETEKLNFNFEGGTQIVITANFEFAYTANADWLSIKKESNKTYVTASVNASLEDRTAEITVSNEKYEFSKKINISQSGVPKEPTNVILYTYSDDKIVTPNKTDVFGANLVSNVYNNGQGVMIFDAPVTSIGTNAFHSCSSLTSVTIPDNVTSIGSKAFYQCTSLTSVTIPDSVTEIETSAFAYSSLTSVTVPDSITSIGNNVFRDCRSLTSVTIPNSVTMIDGFAFKNCSSLTSVTIPNSVTSIGEQAFFNCSSLTSVTIGNSVTEIGARAFYECSGKLIINSNIIGIDHSSTENITQSDGHWLYGSKFTDVTIGGKANEVGNYTFYNYTSLEKVEIAEGVTSIGGWAFDDCTSLTSVTIGNSVTSIRRYAFYQCASLTSVTIGNSVTSIGDSAFYKCRSLTSVTVPDSVTSIGGGAFSDCTSLTSVTIPDSVTLIGSSAFCGCSSLTRVYCKRITPPRGGGSMFDCNGYNRKIFVPRNSVSTYKSLEYWSDYKSDIVGYDF